MSLYQTLGFTIIEKYKKWFKNNKFEISPPTWNEEFELPDGLYSVSDIQEYSKYIFKNHKTVTNNPSIRIYVHKTEIRIPFEIKKGYYLELWTHETMKLLESITTKITKDKNGENLLFIRNDWSSINTL